MRKNKKRIWFSPVFVIFVTIFIDITGFGIILPLLPFYARNFGADSLTLGILVASFPVMQFVFSPILGRLSDRFGRRPVLLLSISFSGVSFVLFAVANSLAALFLSRIIAGMATESAVARAYIADITTEEERSTGIGKVGAAFGAGFIIGPVIGGLTSIFGFSAPGFAAAGLALMNFLSVLFFLPESLTNNKKISTRDVDYGNPFRIALKTPRIGYVLVIQFIIALAFSSLPVILPLLGIEFFGFAEVEMSYFFMYIGVIQIVLQGFLIGKLAKRFGEEILIVLGSLLLMLGTFFVSLFPNVILFISSLTMIASGNGILTTILPSFVSKRTSYREQGGGMGVMESVGSIASIPGPIVGGFVFGFAGLFFAFLLSALLLSIALGLSCKVFQTCKFRSVKKPRL